MIVLTAGQKQEKNIKKIAMLKDVLFVEVSISVVAVKIMINNSLDGPDFGPEN
jgi:hypothetical protein